MEYKTSAKIEEALQSRHMNRMPEKFRKKFKFSRIFMIGNVVLLVIVFAVVLNFMRDNPYTSTTFNVGDVQYRFTANINKEGQLNVISTLKASEPVQIEFENGISEIILYAEGKEVKRFTFGKDKTVLSFESGETKLFQSEITKNELESLLKENGLIDEKNKSIISFIKHFAKMKAVFIIKKKEPIKAELEFTAGV
ncbi:MAG: hypothetical protein KAZ87_03830 [Spirochaetes bacterium]|nr:hypothetical protein [Spirochaetota bacterium]